MKERIQYYRDRVYRFIVQFVKNQDLAQDLTQDVMMKVWYKRENILSLHDVDNYILKMAKHHILDHFKKLAREKSYQEEIWLYFQKTSPSADSPLVRQELDERLDAILKSLPVRQQEVFTLNKRKGLSLEEIATTLNIEVRTVRNHLNRAMKTIRSQIDVDSFLTGIVLVLSWFFI